MSSRVACVYIYVMIGYRIQPVSHCGWIYSLFGVREKINGSLLNVTLNNLKPPHLSPTTFTSSRHPRLISSALFELRPKSKWSSERMNKWVLSGESWGCHGEIKILSIARPAYFLVPLLPTSSWNMDISKPDQTIVCKSLQNIVNIAWNVGKVLGPP